MEQEVIAGFRLSPQQRRLWLQQEGAGAPACAQAQLLLEGEIDTARLKRALEQVVGSHEILRTRFPVPAGMKLPVQSIEESRPLELPESDIAGLSAPEQEAWLDALFEEELSWPLDLRPGGTVSASLVALAPGRRVLILRLPTLCSDAAGLRNLFGELARAYGGGLAGPAGEEDGPVQYADLSEWQHELLESADTAAGRELWRKLLAEPIAEPALPGRRRGSGEESRPQAVEVPLAGAGVEDLATRLEAPVPSVLLAAWAILLARWAAAPELELGLSCDGRRHEVLREALGLLTKFLPLRTRFAPEEPFELAVLRLNEAADELARYHEYFEPDTDRWASLPLGFEFEDWTWRQAAAGVAFSVRCALAPVESPVLRLAGWRSADGVRARLLFDAAAFPEEEAQHLAERLAALLASAAADPRRPAGELDALGETERGLLLRLNGTARLYGPARPLHRLFEEQAARSPAAAAVAFEGAEWTYAELDGRADRVARALAERGVGLESRVGVFVERSLEMVAAVLGVLKAGAAFVPLDPAYPAERLAFMMTDAGISVLLAQTRLLSSLPGRAAATLCVDELLARDGGVAGAAPPEAPAAALAYVIYTSGSTGRPKGVMVSHAAICNHLRWVQEAYAASPGDSMLQKTPLSFDVAIREIFWPLTTGARLVVARPGGHQDSRYLARLAAAERIAVLNFVPSLLRAFLEEPQAASLPSLRRIISGGEALAPDLRDRCRERLGVPLHNQYGPTETAVTSTFWTVAAEDRRELVPIGRPIANAQAHVLDARLLPVFLGAPGELYVGGAGLARGYLDRPDLTAERFVPSPFGDGERLYRTGDLVRARPEGALEFLGRVDQQVKIRGLRVELGEIESVLAALPGIDQAVVAAREDVAGDPRLVAYLVPRAGAGLPAAEELRQRARAFLPDYMLPAAFVALEKLPLTPSGKVDRKSLPAPEEQEGQGSAAPRTQAEELLAGIFCQLLGRRSVGRDDDFFRLGGHSLLGTQLIARVREAFRLDLPLRTVFEAPTVAGLAARIAAEVREDATAAPPLRRRPRAGDLDLPLSFAQRRLWFLHRLEPASAAYNIPGGVRLRGPLDLALLDAVLAEIVRRHEALRTVFPDRAGQPAQVILPPGTVRMPVVDLGGLPEAAREAAALRLAEAEARTPFDLSRGPLLRLRALRLGAEDHLITVTLHHIVSDGWSRGVLVREVVALYRALARGEASPLPELAVQYADYAAWQQEWLQGEVLAGEIAYWRRQLGTRAELLQLPFDRPRPAIYGYRGRQLAIAWPAATAEGVAALSRERGTTLFMTLLGIFQILLARYSGQETIRVGTPVAGRDLLELEELIGFFANTLVLATDLSGSPTVGEVLRRVRGVALDAHAHQNVPFERLVDELQPKRDLSRSPLFQVAFVLQNAPQTRFELPGLELSLLDLDTRTAKFDLTLHLTEERQGLRGLLEYNTDLFDEATVARAAGHLERLVAAAVRDPDLSIWELPLLTLAETGHLLALAGARELHETACLHRLFAAQAALAPGAVALRCGEASLSYGELDRAADRLAHRLRSLGIGPEDAVALCAEPSFDLLVGLLGILKAGAAYVPLDPAYPRERLAFTLEDSAARALVAQERLLDRFPAGLPRVCLDAAEGWRDGSAGPASGPPDVDSLPEQRAYVIYTSGSTGRPKGVAVTHANVTRLFAATAGWSGFGPDDVWTLFHSAAFDFSVWEIWGALLHGGRLVIVPHEVSRSPEDFHALLGREGVTVLNQTPSAFRQLVRVAAERGERRPSLRLVIFGGEALELQSLRPWFELYGDLRPRLVNMYGITETTVHVTCRPIGLPDLAAAGSVIGGPLPDLHLHLLDRAGNLAPVGIPGEIHVGGAGLARGYLGRPDLTAGRFVPDPWSGESGARLYRSGDLARRLAGGDLEYLGRIDEQVKIRGFRIELGEIVAALAALPAVADAAVLAREDGSGGRRLVAWIVPAAGEIAVEALRRALAERLPDYMVPAQFVALPALPLTANGKLDRRALPEPGEKRPDLEEAYMAPSTPAEEILSGVWSRVLGLRRVGVHDNFFSLGGDSILSIQIVALVRERGLEISLHQIFQLQTIAELAPAARLAAGDGAAAPAEPFALVAEADRRRLPADVEDAYPLTLLQDGMLFHMRMAEEEQPYHNVDSFHLRGRFDGAAFAEAWRRVVARHPVLRTAFDLSRYGEPLQLVHREVEPGFEVEDLRGLPAAEQEERIDRFLRGRRSRPLDLARPPLLRFHVHQRTDDTFQFTLIENHAILDGWSLHSTLAEVFQLHLALLGGGEVPLAPPPPVRYRDYVALERRTLEAGESGRFWEERLAGRTLLELPRGPAAPRAAGEPRVRIRRAPISSALSESLKRAARAAAVPTKSVLLAAHLKALSLLTGQTDLVTGLVSNGRPEVEGGEQVRGLFLNTLPFRLRLPAGSWADLAQAVFDEEREILPHRRYPLAAIQQASREPLFEIAFNYIHFHVVDDAMKPGGYEVLETRIQEATNFVLSATFGQDPADGGRVFLQAAYDSSRLSEERILLVERLYVQTLEALAADPGRPHAELSGPALPAVPVSGPGLNDTARTWGTAEGVHRLIAGRSARHPDTPALWFEGRAMTCGELDRLANRLARYLRRLGAGEGAVVAVALERSPEMVAALLGVLKTGAAYLPLDPSFPAERLAFMLADSGASVLVTQESLAAALPPHASTVLLDRDRPRIDAEPADDPDCPVGPRDLAYILYTSGSTGRPKGVEIPHGALLNFLFAMAEDLGLSSADRLLAVTSLSFDISGLELFLPLLVGAAVEIASRETAVDAARLRERLATASVMQATPATWRMLVESGWVGDGRLRVLCGGEPLPWSLAADLLRRAGEVWNLYGPTETTIWSTLQRVGAPREEGVVAIGRPIANTQVYLLDDVLEPVAPGKAGELCIGGAGLARGYHARPELTAAAFVPDPFAAEPGSRLYRTGDRVIQTPDGVLGFVGRADQQVKVRGYRIELGEIEATLTRHPAVRQAVAAVVDAGGDPRLVAWVVPAAGMPPARELRELLLASLPEYMVPAELIGLDALPLLPNRKVDRKALALTQAAGGRPAAVPGTARTPVEELLAGIWRELLRVEGVGLEESFFDLGGHSLLATRLLARVAWTFGLELPLRAVFEAPTISSLARRIEAGLAGGGVAAAPALVAVPRGEPLPLSFAQQRLWFLDQLEPGGAAYNMPLAVRLEGDLDAGAFARALGELTRRHEALRTRFVEIDGEPRQLFGEPGPVALPVCDLGDLEPGRREAEARRLAAEEAAQPFDLAHGPLLRARLVRLGATGHVLLATVHHIVSDGWSMDLLVRELSTLYEAFRCGRPSPLPELPVQYADFAVWQRQWLQGEALAGQLDYWRRHLAGAPPPARLPFRREPAGAVSARGDHRSFAVPAATAGALRRLAREERVTLYMVLLAAFEALLYRATGERDLVVGTDLANRRRAEVEGLIGFFVNVLPVRLNVAGQPAFRELLAQVREVALGVYTHQDVPLEKLVEELAPGRGQGRSPFFEMLFVYLPPTGTAEAAGLRLSPFETGYETSRFDLVLFMSEREGEVRGTFSYRSDLFAAADVERLAERFQALLASAAATPEARLDELDFLTEQERRERAMELEGQEKASLSRFKRIKPKAVTLLQGELVRTAHLGSGEGLPLVVEPNAPDLDLAGWAAGSPEFFEENLARYGALLFRGFHLPAVPDFERFAGAVCPALFGEYGDLPRAGEGKKVYNSTPYPADKTILFHNESSHMHQWPRKQFFYCVLPSLAGGETPIVDCRRIYQLLEPGLRERLETRGLMYVRNFTEGLDVRWQDFFMTDDPAEVEAYCRDNGVEFAWRGESLRTRQIAPAVITHPQTGEKVFFNQIQLHHISCVEPAVRESLTALFAPDEMPRNVFYGDGSPIDDADVRAILSLYWQESVAAPWQQGDALMVDNMLVAHARNPFEGPRKIAVAMGEMFRREWL
ncbi:MAG TPA: amino acid adenylation domain-containing protein [Thermoanaerobaculia bacterium]|jgi:amino acid adenylation domain-containing protein|nr:amino acid adenylation domain-containing protein [Thermoanaerobaculia bacterium]